VNFYVQMLQDITSKITKRKTSIAVVKMLRITVQMTLPPYLSWT